MDRISHKLYKLTRRRQRNRARFSGTATRPRLSVYISNKHITAQIIDDSTHQTLAYITTVGQKTASGTMTDRATWIGNEIARRAKAAKVKQVVFDRGERLYHGRIKALANAARDGGLEF